MCNHLDVIVHLTPAGHILNGWMQRWSMLAMVLEQTTLKYMYGLALSYSSCSMKQLSFCTDNLLQTSSSDKLPGFSMSNNQMIIEKKIKFALFQFFSFNFYPKQYHFIKKNNQKDTVLELT